MQILCVVNFIFDKFAHFIFLLFRILFLGVNFKFFVYKIRGLCFGLRQNDTLRIASITRKRRSHVSDKAPFVICAKAVYVSDRSVPVAVSFLAAPLRSVAEVCKQ